MSPEDTLSAVLLQVAWEKGVGDVVEPTAVDLGVRAKYAYAEREARKVERRRERRRRMQEA
jgi:hypothetical protein